MENFDMKIFSIDGLEPESKPGMGLVNPAHSLDFKLWIGI
jgi:hypothetical protein